MGRSQDPRRTSEARHRRLRSNRCAIFTASSAPGRSGKQWLAFLQNHREAIVAFDFFTLATATFRVLYCFFVIEHDRRRILHCNFTGHPSAEWVVQQLREALPEAGPYRYAILDRDSIFNADVIAFLKATGLTPKRTSRESPWQNGTAERWIGSCRRELLDHIIGLNEAHLRRLVRDSMCATTKRTGFTIPDSLGKDTPNRRPVEPKPAADPAVISLPRLGSTTATRGRKQHRKLAQVGLLPTRPACFNGPQ